MKKLLFIALSFVLISMVDTCRASNIRIDEKPDIRLSGATFKISFPLSWDFSWRSDVTGNYDAAWVFVKFKVEAGAWDHMYLSGPVDFQSPNVPMSYEYGESDVLAENDTYVKRNVGVFIFRSAAAANSALPHNVIQKVTLTWDPSQQEYRDGSTLSSVSTDVLPEQVSIKVFAIEMCYVPSGTFFVGNFVGGNEKGRFRRGDQDEPFFVDSEAPISLKPWPATDKDLSNETNEFTVSSFGMGLPGMLPGEFPKGFDAFYCMKYEITNEAYVDFLNTLGPNQQSARVIVSLTSAAGTKALQFFGMRTSSISIKTRRLAVFACDFNDNKTYDELGDGQNKAVVLRRSDGMAYLDFCGLRMMTELEYEKACRGRELPIPGEFAWGTTQYLLANDFLDEGQPTERPNKISNLIYNAVNLTQLKISRNGIFANDTSTRVASGATRWGIMEMSGNLNEVVVSLVHDEGRKYAGLHGDGRIDSRGGHNMPNQAFWPKSDLNAFGLRGGSFMNHPDEEKVHRVSDRSQAWSTSDVDFDSGFRGVRTQRARLLSDLPVAP